MEKLVAVRKPRGPVYRGPVQHLRDLSLGELEAFVAQHLQSKPYRARQVFDWLHRQRTTSIGGMTNLSQGDRDKLSECGAVDRLHIDLVQRSVDGTRKIRLTTADGHAIESVLIPNEQRSYTQCVSSMVGCSLTCRFCATASLGFARNLATWEILDQLYCAQDVLQRDAEAAGAEHPERITNIVFMGMGEPLHNFNHVQRAIELMVDPRGAAIAPRRITVSTAGMVPAIERFGREGLSERVGLAVSLNATTDEVRDQVMPINTKWNIAALLACLRELPIHRRRNLTFEYVLLRGVNDLDEDIHRLAALVRPFRGHVNLIPLNPHPHAPYERPVPERVDAFSRGLQAKGVRAYVRQPRGDDIAAACGQLALEGEV